MPIIPEALQKKRIQKPYTVRETAIVKQYGSLEGYKKYQEMQSKAESAQAVLSKASSLEEYEKLRQGLPSDVRDLFLSATQLQQEQQKQIETNKQTVQKQVQDRIAQLQQKINDINQRKIDYDKWFRDLPSDKRKSKRDSYDRRMDGYDEDIDKIRDEINGLNRGFNKYANQGASFSDINRYADSYVDYEQARGEARKAARQQLEKISAVTPGGIKINYNDPLAQLKKLQTDVKIPKEFQTQASQRFYLEALGKKVSPYGPGAEGLKAVDWSGYKPTTQQLSVPTGTVTAAPERTTVSAVKQVGSNILYNVKQFASGKPQYISNVFAPISDIKERWVGGQPTKETYLLGDKELQLYPTTTPTMGGKGTSITSFGMSDIKADYSVGISRRIEEKIPVAGTALTAFQEQVYLPDTKSTEKFNELLSSKSVNAAEKLRIFLRDQQAQYKQDVGRLNMLQAQMGTNPTEQDIQKYNELVNKVNFGDKGSLRDVTRTAVQQEGSTRAAVLYGGLTAGQTAYQLEKTYLGFQLGGAAAAGLLPAKVTGAIAGSKTVSTLGKLYVPSLVGAAGFRTATGIVKGEYAPEYLGESAGILIGGLGSYYSKPIVEGGWRLTKYAGRGVRFVGERLGQTGYEQPTFRMGKRGSTMYGGQVAESEYAYGGELYKKRLKQFKDYINRIKETKTFDKSGKEVVVKTFPSAQEKFDRLKPFLDKLNRGDPNKVRDFMKLVRETIGDDLAREFFIQEGFVTPKVKAVERPDTLRFFDSSFQKPIKVTRTIIGTEAKIKTKATTIPTQQIIVKTKLKTLPVESFAEKSQVRSLFGLASLSALRDEQKERQAFAPMSATLSLSKETQTEKQAEQQVSTTRSLFGIAQVSPTVQEQPQIQEPVFSYPQPSRPRKPLPVKPIEPRPFTFELPEFERKKKGFVEKPYDAYVKVDATKGNKTRWVQVVDNVPLITALSRGGSYVDENPSNQFKVVQSKGKLNRIVDVAWNSLSNKFREYSQKSGIKVGLKPGHYIEKRKYRIDSPNERRAIPQAGRVAIARKFGRI